MTRRSRLAFVLATVSIIVLLGFLHLDDLAVVPAFAD
jgi:hypothetical protein